MVLNIDTEDAASVVERIEGMGVTFSVRLEDRGPGIFSTFEDPDGNLTQVLQMTQEYRDAHSLGPVEERMRRRSACASVARVRDAALGGQPCTTPIPTPTPTPSTARDSPTSTGSPTWCWWTAGWSTSGANR